MITSTQPAPLPGPRIKGDKYVCPCGSSVKNRERHIDTYKHRQWLVRWLFRDGIRFPSDIKFGENTIIVRPSGVDVIDWDTTQPATSAGQLGMNATSGRPSAFIGGSARDLLGEHEVIRPDGSVPFAADQPMGSNKITGLADGTAAGDAVNKGQLDAVAAGLSWKDSVRIASTANLTLSGEQTIDGFLTSTDRILVKNQTTPTENGIYVTAAGAWSRATDADTGAEILQAAVFVEEGTANQDTMWVCTTDAPITLGSTNITFTQFGAGGGGESLAATLAIGNTTGGTNIVVSSGDTVNFLRTNNLILTAATIATADRTVTLPDPGGADTVAYVTFAQTLANKTLTTPTIADFTNATHTHQAGSGGGQLDHGAALTGLTDDDHSIYALLAGRSGGQSLIGGTGAGDNLTVESTSNATKGDFVIAAGTDLQMSSDTIYGDTAASGNLVLASTTNATKGAVVPESNNSTDLGTAAIRWKILYCASSNHGDLKFVNGWGFTELWEDGTIGYDHRGKKSIGMMMFNEDGEEIFSIRNDGLFFRGQKIAS